MFTNSMRRQTLPIVLPLLMLCIVCAPCGKLCADETSGDPALYEHIDRLIAARSPNYQDVAAPRAADEEFLRRVFLDLTGTIPAADEVRDFLADGSSSKRAEVIDRLLASPQYARHMQRVFDVMLMRRLPQSNVKTAEWQKFLRTSFAANKPWDQTVREILSADGADAEKRGPARFYLDRSGDVNEITRDVGRIFLGADLECAQCHDHPGIDDFEQADYYGIAAFLVRSFVFTGKDKKSVFAEKAEGEVSFESVFEVRDKVSKGPKSVKPVLLAGRPIDEPEFSEDDAYEVKPAKDVRPIPKFSRRARLAEAMTSPANRRFARTAANRLWALMMGRGLVHPVDADHSGNPPSHPELLELLTDEFVACGYDIRQYLRQLALSGTYQRSSRISPSSEDQTQPPEQFAQAIMKPLSPAQLAWAVLEATGEAQRQRRALGEKLCEETLHQKLAGNEGQFVKLFGGSPGKPPEDFQATVEQVLFLANSGLILNLIKPQEGNLADRLSKLPADNTHLLADELFLSVLSRRPDESDLQDVGDYLSGKEGDARAAAVGELIWSLVASSEFRFNH